MPADEPARLAALHDAGVLDTAPEEDFDDIALLASQICDTPMGLVSFVDATRQWVKARVGIDFEQGPRDLSFCTHTISGHDSFLSTVSHELRTPLSTIRGYLEILLEGGFDTEETMQLDVTELDLADLTHQVVTACRPLAAHKRSS
ncbi:histidine kinase dimerization/phospho-acceptor domain-containing protein [Actinoplanes sp. CA-030573]|uniref:histidine kinase dimerization/phospho-acceptor domain-containing protein n=1 Tax=Actinoplanes sp. CA-030573 TaxID=3239898 RepID=UPI003D92FDF9